MLMRIPSCDRSRSKEFCSDCFQSVCRFLHSRVSEGTKTMGNDSVLCTKVFFGCAYGPASRLSSASMVIWPGNHSPSVKTPLLIFSTVTEMRRWEHLSASSRSFIMLISALYFVLS